MATNNCLNTYIVPTTANEVTMPSQPAFLANMNASDDDVTGDGTQYFVTYDTEIFDQNSDFNTGTYTFTAPVTGRYFATYILVYHDIAANHGDSLIQMHYSNNQNTQSFRVNPSVLRYGGSTINLTGSQVIDMDAADICHIALTISGGTKTVDVTGGGAGSWFGMELLC